MQDDDGSRGKSATQDRILAAAAGVLVERGYAKASISQIAARAGISRAAVFWHFGDKASLFREVCRQLIQPFIDKLDEQDPELPPRKRIFEWFSIYERFVTERRETIGGFVRWYLEAPGEAREPIQALMGLHDRFAEKMGELVEELVPDRGEAQAVAAGLLALLDGNLFLGLLGADPSLQERRAAALRLLAESSLPQS